MQRLLLTGFQPFLDNEENPTETLSRSHGGEVLEVSYEVVDSFLEEKAKDYDFILSLGLHARSKEPRIERFAYNQKSRTHPDSRGLIPEDPAIAKDGPERLGTTTNVDALLDFVQGKGFEATASEDPGRYLCNYIYYNALAKMKGNALFIHFPPAKEEWPIERMKAFLEAVLEYLR